MMFGLRNSFFLNVQLKMVAIFKITATKIRKKQDFLAMILWI